MTVCSVTQSCRAMRPFEAPLATSRRISISRGVSFPCDASARTVAGRLAKAWWIVPAQISRTSRPRVVGCTVLAMAASAPARTASPSQSASGCPVSTMIFAAGTARRISAMRATALADQVISSTITTSGPASATAVPQARRPST